MDLQPYRYDMTIFLGKKIFNTHLQERTWERNGKMVYLIFNPLRANHAYTRGIKIYRLTANHAYTRGISI